MELMQIRRNLLNSNYPLPPMYKRVEYIQARSYAHIITDYVPTRNDEIYVRFMPDSVSSSMNCLFSAGNGTYQLIALGYAANGKQAYYCKYFASGGAKELIANNTAGLWTTMTVNASGQFTSNGVSITSTYDNEIDGTNKSLLVFRRANTNNPYIGKLASFVITNNGTKKLELIPCIRMSDSIAGAYNTVAKHFYSSYSSLEEFTAGPVV